MGNPFVEDNGGMLTLDTRAVMNKDAFLKVNKFENVCQRNVSDLMEERLKTSENISLYI